MLLPEWHLLKLKRHIISVNSSLRGTKQSLADRHLTLIDYKLHPCNLSFGLHKTHSILLLAKLVPRYRSQ